MPERLVTFAVIFRYSTAKDSKRQSANVTGLSKTSLLGCSDRTSYHLHCSRLCVLAHRPPFLSAISSLSSALEITYRHWDRVSNLLLEPPVIFPKRAAERGCDLRVQAPHQSR